MSLRKNRDYFQILKTGERILEGMPSIQARMKGLCPAAHLIHFTVCVLTK